MIKKLLAVLLGGFIGGGLREFLEIILQNPIFPWATLLINLTGTFALSYLNFKIVSRWPLSPTVAVGLTTGLIGSYTTFSTLVLETNEMLEHSQFLIAGMYLLVSFGGGLLMAKLGMKLGGQKND